jgi:hypothetical protein
MLQKLEHFFAPFHLLPWRQDAETLGPLGVHIANGGLLEKRVEFQLLVTGKVQVSWAGTVWPREPLYNVDRNLEMFFK